MEDTYILHPYHYFCSPDIKVFGQLFYLYTSGRGARRGTMQEDRFFCVEPVGSEQFLGDCVNCDCAPCD